MITACEVFYVFLPLALTFHNLGGDAAMKNEKPEAFLFHCSRLALTFHNLGGGAAMKNEKPEAFLFHCSRLALTLPTKYII